MAKLLQNNCHLCQLLYDDNRELYPFERESLLRIADFYFQRVKNQIIGLELKDIVLCGGITSHIYNETTDIDLGLIVNLGSNISDSEEQRKFLKLYNPGYQSRGFNFCILNRKVDYGMVNYLHAGSGTYSILQNKWLSVPQYREFSFSLDEFYLEYCQFSSNVHDFAYSLERYHDSFLTLKSCKMLKEYLYNLRENALNSKVIHTEQEYCLDYCLYRCLKRFGVIAFFNQYIVDSYNYHLNVLNERIEDV